MLSCGRMLPDKSYLTQHICVCYTVLMTKKWSEITKEELERVVSSSVSKAEVLRRLGRKVNGGNNTTLNMHLERLGIDTAHMLGQASMRGKTKESSTQVARQARAATLSPEDVLFNGSHKPTITIRRVVLRNELIDYSCQQCGNIGMWNGRELSLDLDHIDGNKSNNDIRNLRFLCPNCHRVTPTWGDKS